MRLVPRQRWVLVGVILIGAGIGYWHLRLALRSVFVFREDDPIVFLVALIVGPLVTLPAIAISTFRPRWGAFCLLAGAGISGVAAAFAGREMLEVVGFLLYVSVPMVGLGVALIAAGRPARNT